MKHSQLVKERGRKDFEKIKKGSALNRCKAFIENVSVEHSVSSVVF